MSRNSGRAGWVALAVLALAGCGSEAPDGPRAAPEPEPGAAPAEVTWVGGERCAGCHPEAARAWRGSHHDLAMQAPTPDAVLGDFDGARVVGRDGEQTVFLAREDGFFVRTRGPDGAVAEFPVAWTFGVEPLQQVLLRLPDGRLQAFDLAWDARPASEGGQRWYRLRPEEDPAPGDPMHWTGLVASWDAMCADCHSTNLRRRWDAAAGRYAVTWSEEDVSCEACHGPGSRHVAWAEARTAAAEGGAPAPPPEPDLGLAVPLGSEAVWRFAPGASIARRQPPRPADDPRRELATCAPCHARRSPIAADAAPGDPFLDGYRPALLDGGDLYHADGQILDEVYVWGSFVQSRMHAAGVTCSDCHDPHALRIPEPDAACATCHRPEVFAAPAHHRHPADSAGASCVACHMPARTYMGVDARRDHSFRVPRPDLTRRLGTPNACAGCHPGWSGARLEEAARGMGAGERPGTAHYGEALHAGRTGAAGADAALAALAGDAASPGIARASAVRLLRDPGREPAASALRAALADADPLVRMAAAEAAERLPPAPRLEGVRPLLDDPRRAVRIQAARVLAGVPPGAWPPGGRARLADALAEYRAAQRTSLDRPEAHLNLGVLHALFGELEQARAAYETALRVGPWFVPAYVNLADLHRERGDEAAALAVLRRGLAREPDDPALHHALGLALVRQGRLDTALPHLARAAEGDPANARYAYVHAFALHGSGETERALEVLERARARHPEDRSLLLGLASLEREAGRPAAARRHVEALLALDPDDPRARALLADLDAAD